MRTHRKPSRLLFLVVVAVLSTPLASTTAKAQDSKWTLVTGSGNFVSRDENIRGARPTMCHWVSRDGNVAFSGLIDSALLTGKQQTRNLRDACADPVQGTAKTTYILDEATVAGGTGTLVIEAKGIFEGDVTSPAGARTRLHFSIRGISGDLRGATGVGHHVGQGTTTGSFNIY